MGAMARGGWSDSVTPVAPPSSARPGVRTMAYAALVTGAWSGVLSLAIYGFARLIGVPMQVEIAGSLQTVPWSAVLLVPIIAAEVGAIASLVVRGWNFAGRIVFWVGTLVAFLSLTPLVFAPADVPVSTLLWLTSLHVITWLLVVPQIARIIGDSEPGMHAEREVIYS